MSRSFRILLVSHFALSYPVDQGNAVAVTLRIYLLAQDPILPDNTVVFIMGALNAPTREATSLIATNASLHSQWSIGR